MDRLHHPLEDGIQQLPRLLGVPVGEELHRALEVGEEHRDLLALAFEGRLGGQDPLSEVLGRVRLGGGETRLARGFKCDRRAALVAEPRPWRELVTARTARTTEACPAAEAKVRPRRVLVLALGAPHGAFLPSPALYQAGRTPSCRSRCALSK